MRELDDLAFPLGNLRRISSAASHARHGAGCTFAPGVLLHKAARLGALLQLVHHRNKDVLVRRLPIAASCCLLQALGRVCARLGGGVRAVAFPDVRPVRGAGAGADAAGANLGMNLATSRPGNENGPRVGARFAGCMAERAGQCSTLSRMLVKTTT